MLKTKDIFAVRDGNITADELLEKYPVKEVVNSLMKLIQNAKDLDELISSDKPILVTVEEFDRIKRMFRIKGYDINGNPSNRGRKPKQPIKAED